MWELENGVARGEPDIQYLLSILHAMALLKAVLPFDFVNTAMHPMSSFYTALLSIAYSPQPLLLILDVEYEI